MKGSSETKERSTFSEDASLCSSADLCWINSGIQWPKVSAQTPLSLGRVSTALGEAAIQNKAISGVCNEGPPKTQYFVI